MQRLPKTSRKTLIITKPFFDYAKLGRTRGGKEYKGVIAQILTNQTTKDIDTVSGATYSSRTIIDTVKKLIGQAAKDDPGEEGSETGKKDDSGSGKTDDAGQGSSGDSGSGKTDDEGSETGKTDDSGSGKTDDSGQGSSDDSGSGKTGDEGSETGKTDDSGSGKTDEEEETQNKYEDGKYTASAICEDPDGFFYYKVEVTVTIKDGAITKVSVDKKDDVSDDPEENEYYLDQAVNGKKSYTGIPKQVIDSQSASDLDTVSRATYSSNAIIKAVKEALEDAKP